MVNPRCLDYFFFFQAEDGIRDVAVTGVQTCALPILSYALSPAPNTVPGIESSRSPVAAAPGWPQRAMLPAPTNVTGPVLAARSAAGGRDMAVGTRRLWSSWQVVTTSSTAKDRRPTRRRFM